MYAPSWENTAGPSPGDFPLLLTAPASWMPAECLALTRPGRSCAPSAGLESGRVPLLPQSGFFRSGDFSRLDAPYQKPLRRLHSLGLEAVPRKYTGASFDFDPLNAFFDREIVLPFDRAERITGEALFPVGSVEPDGISCVGPSGRVYTLFDDSLFLSGPSVVDYLNGRFLKELKPVPLFSLPE